MNYSDEAVFDAYLDALLSKEERADFEARLGRDEALRDSFGSHRQMRELIEIAALKEKLRSIHQTAAEPEDSHVPPAGTAKRTKPLYTFRFWHAAAAILIMLAGAAVWKTQSKSPGDKLYAKYYAPDAGLPGLMGNASQYELDDAMVDFKSGDYDAALQKLEGLQKAGVAGDTVTYYIGMSLLGQEKFREAERTLQLLRESANVFRSKAVWYSALAYVKTGRMSEAKALLEEIAGDPVNTRSGAAKALLAEWPE